MWREAEKWSVECFNFIQILELASLGELLILVPLNNESM